ncbi:MAG: AbrB/MazE/SpoVT family DNA-binding domain-containing protein [Thaumarchaeota archaeon]|jgi:AbrB family looped-hinge helix DNA binding protein|nr:AbrB/MazE/SpoVT family DNA-binding domain-containing protein [Candidatus Geocrenenecus arthurdayi]MCL7388813.1 AbrB/MazE/SpoVT family DNA-binding domain-containing protein [Candidatus Geocrenenecus arthurdayi]MCL7391435.1 AbrB/MazE/SpoVT family DNA-binding domain-containing protein [Candidatus Geocrenenecus arthurdayi]MCL7397132.1 AbrB/MazE/SpoVT family DNA-binding domain-containing protein [Candidatus Geocrenenecus arthurdayi]MCL7404135.1 AbrB/MazE/SpoVT family DNA-binding domain-containing
MRVVLKIRKKGILILPKRLREAVGLEEGDDVVVEVVGDGLVLRALKPKVVDVDPKFVEELLREEDRFEEQRLRRMLQSEENSA